MKHLLRVTLYPPSSSREAFPVVVFLSLLELTYSCVIHTMGSGLVWVGGWEIMKTKHFVLVTRIRLQAMEAYAFEQQT